MGQKRTLRVVLGRCLLYFPSLVWVVALLYFEGIFNVLLVGLCALFHECGHLLAFSLLGLPTPQLRIVSGGLRLQTAGWLSYRQEGWIAFAGPLANLVIWGISLLFPHLPWLTLFGETSLFTALGNLAPTGELDGERILTCLLSSHLAPDTVQNTVRWLGFTILAGVLLASLVLLWLGVGAIYPAFLAFGALLAEKRGFDKKRGKMRKTE